MSIIHAHAHRRTHVCRSQVRFQAVTLSCYSEIGDRLRRVNYWDITITQANSALHPPGSLNRVAALPEVEAGKSPLWVGR